MSNDATTDLHSTDFTRRLHDECLDGWDAVVGHRFVDELFAGTLDDGVLVHYLVQDYQFFDPFLRLLGEAVATAPTSTARLTLARQMGMLATVENGYFEGTFDHFGVTLDDRLHPTLTSETVDLVDLMEEAIGTHSWPHVLAVLVVLEWIYLAWAEAPRHTGEPGRPEHQEWIDLHRGHEFSEWVTFLRRQLDDAEPHDAADSAQCHDFFRNAVAAELAFFDGAYRPSHPS